MRGSWRGKIRKEEPENDGKTPQKPVWLTNSDAVCEWERVCGRLSEQGILDTLDQSVLALYCAAYGDYIRLQTEVDRTGIEAAIKPISLQLHKAWERVIKGAALFGMSPAGRAGLAVPGKGKSKDNGKDRFFRTG
jgi:P27 family predicted phage terminase small subunit